jgi:hypothetical protein
MEDQSALAFEQKFRWSSVFDLFELHRIMLKFMENLKKLDTSLQVSVERLVHHFESPTSLYKKLSTFYASKNTLYFKQI